jgi:DHA3 family macrolide efflux protein-like MFS transporter
MRTNQNAFRLLFLANTVSGVAQGISMLAIPWYFTSIINQPQLLGIIYFIASSIQVIWGMYTGVLVDKYSRKNIFIYVNSFGGILLLAVAIIGYSSGEVSVFITSLVFISTFFIYNIHYPNLYAFAQELTHSSDYSRINSQIEIVGQLTSMVAGAVASSLLSGSSNGDINVFGFIFHGFFTFEAWTLQDIFLLDGITYVISLFIIASIKYTPIHERVSEVGTVIERLKTGLNFLKDKRHLLIFGIASLSVFLTVIVGAYMLNPWYVLHRLKGNAGVFGASEMYFAFGALFTGLTVTYLFGKSNPIRSVLILMILTSAIYFAMIFNTYLPFFYFLMFIYGICNAGVRILRLTYLFNNIPNNVMGRVSSVFLLTHLIFRLFFIGLFTLPFFSHDNILRSYIVFAIFLLLSGFIIVSNYKTLTKEK